MQYNIGDKFWRVNKIFANLLEKRNKLKMIDADGIEWYRYDKDSVEFDLKQVEIVGKFEVNVEGRNIWNEDEYCSRYCMKIGDTYDEVWEEELTGEIERSHYVTYWHTKEEAEEYIKKQREFYNGL